MEFIKKNKAFCLFALLALLIILGAVFAPVFTGGVSPTDAVLKDALQAPSAKHICGTDKLGRDVFARVIYGARTSLTATFAVVAIIFVLGACGATSAPPIPSISRCPRCCWHGFGQR